MRFDDIQITSLNTVNADYQRTHEASMVILNALSTAGIPVGYALLACAVTLGRLLNHDRRLEDEAEIAFVQAVMDWCGAYFHEGEAN